MPSEMKGRSMPPSPATRSKPPLACCDVWKIFGERSADALRALRDGSSKAAIKKSLDAVVGVAGVSFEAQEGETFCIMGLSGSGKSTLVRLLNRLIERTEGRITVYGEDISLMSADALRQLRSSIVSMVFQNVALLPHRSVIDNVAYGLEVRGVPRTIRYEMAHEKLSTVGLNGWERRFGHELSGGMQQRVGLARALACDPKILLMDEPFSALDPIIRRDLQIEFRRLSSQLRKTTIFITHDLDEAIRLGDRIAIMRDGQFDQVGTPSEVMLNPANDYVARFVAEVSPLSILSARHVMRPLDRGVQCSWANASRLPLSASLQDIFDASAASADPVLIVNDAGCDVGQISKDDVIRALSRNGRGVAAYPAQRSPKTGSIS